MTSSTGHLENAGSLSYADLANVCVDTFLFYSIFFKTSHTLLSPPMPLKANQLMVEGIGFPKCRYLLQSLNFTTTTTGFPRCDRPTSLVLKKRPAEHLGPRNCSQAHVPQEERGPPSTERKMPACHRPLVTMRPGVRWGFCAHFPFWQNIKKSHPQGRIFSKINPF